MAKKQTRNGLVSAMNRRHTSSRPMRDRREKRQGNRKRSWKEEA